MTRERQFNAAPPPTPPVRRRMRFPAIALAVVALVVAAFALDGSRSVLAQEGPDCAVNDLGVLGAEPGSALLADGRWTTGDCDSRFRAGSDAHTYRFEIAEAGRIRIELASGGADTYLYLLAEDGSRITDNDDGAAGLDARIELVLEPGSYLVEATTVGGRGRGPADFSLSIERLSCDVIDLGLLVPGAGLTASGIWTIDTCGSQIVAAHPAYNYTFVLPEAGRVRIDLVSENGDPVLSLGSPTLGVIGANDDGGDGRNARIEQYLPAGPYAIEATTYLRRDLQPLDGEFTLDVRLVDEAAAQQAFLLKIEEILAPGEVIAGQHFRVDYRVGNIGGGELPEGARLLVYVVGPQRVFDRTPTIEAVPGAWQPGGSYHSGPATATATSTAIGAVTPFAVAFGEPGPAWLFAAVVAFDGLDEDGGFGEEIAWHGLWQNVMVLSGLTYDPVDGLTFDPVTVSVDGVDYRVAAVLEADDDADEGAAADADEDTDADADAHEVVTTSVSLAADPDAEVAPALGALATFAAGVRAHVLDGIFDRDAIAALPLDAEPVSADIAGASVRELLAAFGEAYAATVTASGLAEVIAAGEAIDPRAVEDLTLDAAAAASARYAAIAASWRDLLDRVEAGEALTFAEAFAVQAQLAHAERILAPAITAGEIVRAARAAEFGWWDPGVRAMIGDLAGQVSCFAGTAGLRAALGMAGVPGAGALLALDAELRAALPVHSLATDSAICAALAADAANWRFLRALSIEDSAELQELFAFDPAPSPVVEPPPTAPAPAPVQLRVIARPDDNGRVELGVELAGGEQRLPRVRTLSADAEVGRWKVSTEVEVDGNAIGRIRVRRLADGGVELGFRSAAGERIVPDVRYVPADPTAGVWFRSSEIVVPPPPAPSE